MDIYHGWFSLKDGVKDTDFADAFERYMAALKKDGKIESYRLMRCKLGLRPVGVGEFHFMIEVRDLAQLDEAFNLVATRAGAVEGLHFGANSMVRDISFALYRDFPDEVRERGEEKF